MLILFRRDNSHSMYINFNETVILEQQIVLFLPSHEGNGIERKVCSVQKKKHTLKEEIDHVIKRDFFSWVLRIF